MNQEIKLPIKIAFGVMTVLFVVFASLQFNDLPQYKNADAWSWIIIYLITAGLSAWPIFKSINRTLIASYAGFSLGSFIFRMQDQYGNFQMEKFAGKWLYNERGTEMIQQTNEAGGLFIVFVWMLVLYFLTKPSTK